MKSNSELRAEARKALKGNWNTSALFYFVYYLLVCVIVGLSGVTGLAGDATVFTGNIIALILVSPLIYGVLIGFLQQFRGKEQKLGMLFGGFTQRIWGTMILKFIYILLWAILLIIPGIVKQFSYAMTEYILKDHPELSNNAAIDLSRSMMHGHKLKLFCLQLSFLGWVLLSILTFGIALFWVMPYIYTAQAAFYEDLKKQYESENW